MASENDIGAFHFETDDTSTPASIGAFHKQPDAAAADIVVLRRRREEA